LAKLDNGIITSNVMRFPAPESGIAIEEFDGCAQDDGNLEKSAGSNTVEAGFVFLNLLERDADFGTERRLTEPDFLASAPNARADETVDRVSGSRHGSLQWLQPGRFGLVSELTLRERRRPATQNSTTRYLLGKIVPRDDLARQPTPRYSRWTKP
jgi:hypothetical protein